MRSTNFNLRGVPTEVMITLKREAHKQQISVNLLILKLIQTGIGHAPEVRRQVFHDLDKLAGTWSVNEAKDFEKNVKDFEKIDRDLWS